jgi:CRP/FNR family transcriptional regulator, dissimilatory nitrate respiration regulator
MNVLNSKPLLTLLHGAISYRDLINGQTLFYQGDRAESVFVVESGKIRLAHFTQDGKVIQHYDVVAGESFAEAGLFISVYDCAAIAEIPSRVMVLPNAANLAFFMVNLSHHLLADFRILNIGIGNFQANYYGA